MNEEESRRLTLMGLFLFLRIDSLWVWMCKKTKKKAIVECNLPCRGGAFLPKDFFEEQTQFFDWFFSIGKNVIQSVIQWVFCAGSGGGCKRACLIGPQTADRARGFLQLEQGRRRHHCYGYSSPTFFCFSVVRSEGFCISLWPYRSWLWPR